ncbi:MAG TPA: carbamate kinase [Vicinamibacteria bacterium]|jgi:carbamate kinase|nr:carbamate kinase [Vicinamibacteria bacterium]
MSGTVVVALGGNAVAPPAERPTIVNQFRHTRESLAPIVELARRGWNVAIVHGNGPQVGEELLRNETARDRVEPLPLGVLVAATAGWMGYMIQQSLQNALRRAGIRRRVVTLVTQTLCDTRDPRSKEPVKPIGHPLAVAQRESLRRRSVPVGRDGAGRWRRMAPSPRPTAIVESDIVRTLVHAGDLVVTCGGGGPPVYDDPKLFLEGVDAVVDKDRVAAILGRELRADVLLILTDVDAVYRGWGKPGAHPIHRLTLVEADSLLTEGETQEGSMRPKLEAAIDFVRAGGARAVIADLGHGLEALEGLAGTTVVSGVASEPADGSPATAARYSE